MPLPNNSLRYVFVYVFETDDGPYLVDTGWNTDEAFGALTAGLSHLGTSVEAVRGVLVTHIHPDHYGLAGRVREASGAWVALHPADAALIKGRYEDPTALLDGMGSMLRRMGAPPDENPHAPERLHARAWPRRRDPARRPVGGRRSTRGAGLGSAVDLDTRALTWASVLLGADQSPDALGRPRAAADHPQRLAASSVG